MKQLQLRNIFGRKVAIKGGDEGVIKVNGVPANPEPGKIYYNTVNGEYYTGGDSRIDTIATSGNYEQTVPKHWKMKSFSFTVSPGQYSVKPYIVYSGSPNADSGGVLRFNLTDEYPDQAKEYIIRYTHKNTVQSIVFSVVLPGLTISVPDSAQEILSNLEVGHTYEFNIFGRVLLVTDITAS